MYIGSKISTLVDIKTMTEYNFNLFIYLTKNERNFTFRSVCSNQPMNTWPRSLMKAAKGIVFGNYLEKGLKVKHVINH